MAVRVVGDVVGDESMTLTRGLKLPTTSLVSRFDLQLGDDNKYNHVDHYLKDNQGNQWR